MTQTTQAGHISREQLNAFVDGEVSSVEMQTVERHLAECHACTLRVLAATQLKRATATAAQGVTAPPDALARLTAQLRQQEPPKKKARVYAFPAAGWAALAACLLIALSLLGWRQISQANTTSAELLDHHLAALSSGATPEVISTDRHTVKPWFQGKLPFSFNLPEVLPPDTVLKGGDLAYAGGQPAAMLLYTIHKHEVSVFLTQRSNRIADLRPVARSGFAIRYASTKELSIAAVSDLNPAELDLLVAAIAHAQ
jgi:anti-sigma factor RsiW